MSYRADSLNLLYRFGRHMWSRLNQPRNAEKRGWHDMSYPELEAKLQEEFYEVKAELSAGSAINPGKVVSEILDVGVVAFFIWDKATRHAADEWPGKEARERAEKIRADHAKPFEFVSGALSNLKASAGSPSWWNERTLEQAVDPVESFEELKPESSPSTHPKRKGATFKAVDGVPVHRIANLGGYLEGQPMRITAGHVGEPTVNELQAKREKAEADKRERFPDYRGR